MCIEIIFLTSRFNVRCLICTVSSICLRSLLHTFSVLHTHSVSRVAVEKQNDRQFPCFVSDSIQFPAGFFCHILSSDPFLSSFPFHFPIAAGKKFYFAISQTLTAFCSESYVSPAKWWGFYVCLDIPKFMYITKVIEARINVAFVCDPVKDLSLNRMKTEKYNSLTYTTIHIYDYIFTLLNDQFQKNICSFLVVSDFGMHEIKSLLFKTKHNQALLFCQIDFTMNL